MTLATGSGKSLWAATVFFAYDDDFNLYFYSNPTTLHCRNIAKDSGVVFTINQDWGGHGKIRGIQGRGNASKPTGYEYVLSFNLFEKRYSWVKQFPNHVIYKIAVSEMYLIDSTYYGHFDRMKVKD